MKTEDIKKGFPETLPFPKELALLIDWVNENGYPISGCFELRADDGDTMFYWFGFRDVESKLGQFGAGADGSLYCIWDTETGVYPIVHMGSEGDEIKVLAENFVDFLRLLAIGYDELGFEELTSPPEEDESNPVFQQWVKKQFGVSIPKVGSELSINENLDFESWVNKALKQYS